MHTCNKIFWRWRVQGGKSWYHMCKLCEQDALISKLKAELTDLTKSYLLQKQHLEDKSYRISVLQSSFNEL